MQCPTNWTPLVSPSPKSAKHVKGPLRPVFGSSCQSYYGKIDGKVPRWTKENVIMPIDPPKSYTLDL